MIILSCLRSRLKYSIDSFLDFEYDPEKRTKVETQSMQANPSIYSCVHFLAAQKPSKHASFLLLLALVIHLGHKRVKHQKFKNSLNLEKKFTLTPSRESPSVEPMLTRLPCDNLSIEVFFFTNSNKIGRLNEQNAKN